MGTRNETDRPAHSDTGKFDAALHAIYYDPDDAGSYGGIDRLFQRAVQKGLKGITRKDVINFLSAQRSYSLHKPTRRNFVRNKTIVKGIDVQWQADLADMQGLSRQNGGMKYLLTCIDVFRLGGPDQRQVRTGNG